MNDRLNGARISIDWLFSPLKLALQQPVILLYHEIPRRNNGNSIHAELFEQHITFLIRHFECVSPNHSDKVGRIRSGKAQVLLTFDDGLRNNAEVAAPILRKYNVPASFFISSRHVTSGKYLWFSYLAGLEKHFRGNGFYFRDEFMDMSPAQRQLTVLRLRQLLLTLTPHPAAMYQAIEEELPRLEDFLNKNELADYYDGMTAEQVGELATDPLFSIGVHTVDHPFLSKCKSGEALRQIQDNKIWLEQISHQPCDTIAYPGGDYNADILRQCGDLGFSRGYALIPSLNLAPPLELPRIGIYATSLAILGLKARWGNWMRALNIKVG